ncbi:hypothetical protein GFS31_19600 [Leptolyngbya sp. BL0902]|nr:hypothetical protein GFS31_19600 [Leptolyngbya sp. BL0902]
MCFRYSTTDAAQDKFDSLSEISRVYPGQRFRPIQCCSR